MKLNGKVDLNRAFPKRVVQSYVRFGPHDRSPASLLATLAKSAPRYLRQMRGGWGSDEVKDEIKWVKDEIKWVRDEIK